MQLVVVKSPSEAMALTNCVIVSPEDAKKLGNYVMINNQHILSLLPSPIIPTGNIGLSGTHRKWLQTALNDVISVESFEPAISRAEYLESIRLEVDLLRNVSSGSGPLTLDTDRMAELFLRNFERQVMSLNQPLVMEFGGHNLSLKVHSLSSIPKTNDATSNKSSLNWGILLPKSIVSFSKSTTSDTVSMLKLIGSQQVNSNAIIQPNFKFEDMGIGGLDEEFWIIFRRAFASRIYPQDLVQKLGIRHVKGLILYGPPGTGKTLMARQIAKMLHAAREPKIVNGPEILNKFVGQSEENIRNLFKEAEMEYKAKGDDSQLHIIIFDELDAICKQRGAGRGDGTGVGDSVVNQLLAKMDGVEQLNNILIIGMTNRLDMLDEALLRPGRFEVQLEIGLPNEQGRLQILKIHTNTMRKNNILANNVDLEELSRQCKNFTGAEIVGLINSATSFALNRHIKVGERVEVAKDASSMKVSREDFDKALEEVHAAYGIDEDQFSSCGQEGVLLYSDEMKAAMEQASLVIKKAATTDKTTLSAILLHGSTGSGKTAFAAKLATNSNFPFVKLLSTHTLVGLSESAKISTISKLFLDAYKSQQSLIVIDDVEDLIEYVSIGPRFSTSLLQTFRNFFKKAPPEGRRLVIIATTRSRRLLDQLGLSTHFRTILALPNVDTLEHLHLHLTRNQLLTTQDQQSIYKELKKLVSRGVFFSVPVKILQDMLEIAAQDTGNVINRFMDELQQYLIYSEGDHDGVARHQEDIDYIANLNENNM